jgi:hypothetical protein
MGRQLKFLVLTDPFGKVVAVLDTSSRDYLAPPDIDPIMLISLAQIGIAVGAAIGRYLVAEAIEAAAVAAATFRQAMLGAERKLIARGATVEANAVRVLTEEELALVKGWPLAAFDEGPARPGDRNATWRRVRSRRVGRADAADPGRARPIGRALRERFDQDSATTRV